MRALFVEHSPLDPPGLLGEWLSAAGAAVQVCRPYAGDRVPQRPADAAADVLVVLGGAMNSWDDEATPWLPATRALLARAVAEGVPTLGVCLGAQLLAQACGGTAARGAAGPEIGVCDVELLPAAGGDPLLAGTGTRPAVQWHWDAVTTLPPGAVLLARSGSYPVQAFGVGPAAWGVQFHPEVDEATVAAWARDDAGALAELRIDPDRVVAEAAARAAELRARWRPLAENLLSVRRPVAASGGTP